MGYDSRFGWDGHRISSVYDLIAGHLVESRLDRADGRDAMTDFLYQIGAWEYSLWHAIHA